MNIKRLNKGVKRFHGEAQFEVRSIESFSQQTVENKSALLFHPAYAIIWIVDGSGKLRIDLEEFKMDAETVCYIKPSQAFDLEIRENTTGFVICFSMEFIELYAKTRSELTNILLFNHFLIVPVIKLKKGVSCFLKNMVAQMAEELKNYFDLKFEAMTGFLKIFLIYLVRQFDLDINKNSFYSRKNELVNSFYSQLELNFSSKKSAKDYAALLKVSPSYLNDVVKELSGNTVSHHIKQRVVLEAKRKAIFQGDSMKQIAYCLGFLDSSHFSKYFKKGSGENFTDFKKGIGCFNEGKRRNIN